MLRHPAGLLAICLCAILLPACAAGNAAAPAPGATAGLPITAPEPSAPPAQPSALVPTRAPDPTRAQALAPSPTPRPAGIPADLVLRGALIDGTGGPPLDDALVAIAGGRIVAVGRAGELAIAPGARAIELPGATILPGFVNAHVHSYTLTPEQMQGWTRAGVTTVRDLSAPLDMIVARKRDFAAGGDARLPRLLVAGPMVTVPGGHPIPIYGLNDRVLAVRGPEDARRQADALLDAGVDLIKIAVSGRSDVDWPELSNDEIAAISAAARARGARVAAHVDRAVALRRAVENGITDAAHAPRDRMPDDLIAMMVERGVALVPTIDVYEGLAEERGDGDGWRRTTMPVMYDNLRRFVAAGGVLALGDDYGNPRVALGMPMPEIEHWIAAGLTPMQVIVAATHGGAIVCGLERELGTLAPGSVADILVVQGDPLADIHALERPVLVVHGGAIAFAARQALAIVGIDPGQSVRGTISRRQ
jgi:imidazolonepropionase-like amidohydrolase